MQGNFTYYNPTKLYFGEASLDKLKDELANFGERVLLNYGSGSVKRNGIYDQVVAILREGGKTIIENPGVMSNPTLEKLDEGIRIARENQVDWILSLGGGSVCDYSKGVAASAYFEGDYWKTFWMEGNQPPKEQRILPIGCILTMAGTGSEMNGGAVITDAANNNKLGHVFDSRLNARPGEPDWNTCDIYVREPGTKPYSLMQKDVSFVEYIRAKGFEIIPIDYDDEMHYANNYLTIAPRHIMAVAGQSETFQQRLAEAGVTVEWVPLENLIKGYGAAHCMTQVLKRERNR